MISRVRFITSVSFTLGDKWQWTKPCNSPKKSIIAAENMVSARLMDEMKISRNFKPFGSKLRSQYPEIVEVAQQYIGETREVILPEGTTRKQFQEKFHSVQYNPEVEKADPEIEEEEEKAGADE